jgi:endoglucanase
MLTKHRETASRIPLAPAVGMVLAAAVCCCRCLGGAAIAAEPSVFDDPFFKSLEPAYGRGVNLGNALEAPREGAWGVVLQEEYFDKIKQAGFDSVRIPVRWSAHAEKSPPYRIDPKFFERVDWAVRQALDRRLLVVLNMHHYDEIFKDPDGHRERFLAIWGQIAERYKGLPPAVSFELLNEPHASLDAARWNRMAADAIALVRKTNPTRKIVVGPVGWNNINELGKLELPEQDRNLVVTVHYYNPFRFTHQGASWVGGESQKWLGTKWTGTEAERKAITDDLDKAIAWAVRHRRPIYLGEFGAYSRADMDSRARWTRFVADEAMKRKIGFAYWEFCAGFGVYDAQAGAWREPLKEALLPPDRAR